MSACLTPLAFFCLLSLASCSDRDLSEKQGDKRSVGALYETDQDSFRSWLAFSSERPLGHQVKTRWPLGKASAEVELTSLKSGQVGINRAVDLLRGVVTFEYQIGTSGSKTNVAMFAIPVKATQRPGITIECGTDIPDDPRSGFSALRAAFWPPPEAYDDGKWHFAQLEFDFTSIPDAKSAVIGARVNEGTLLPAPGTASFRRVRIFAAKR